MSRATPSKPKNKASAPRLSEKTKKLTLKAFRMTYEARQRERDRAVKEIATQPKKASNNAKRQGKATKAARQKELSSNEATLRAWKKTYANRKQSVDVEDSTNKSKPTTRPAKRRKPEAPQLPEKTRKLILRAFQKTYEAHHGKSS